MRLAQLQPHIESGSNRHYYAVQKDTGGLEKAKVKRSGTIARRTSVKTRRSGRRRGGVVDKMFVAFMHSIGICLIAAKGFTGCSGRLTLHHVRNYGSPKDDRKSLLLCAAHHLHDFGVNAIERGKKRWAEMFRIDIDAEIANYNRRFEAWKSMRSTGAVPITAII